MLHLLLCFVRLTCPAVEERSEETFYDTTWMTESCEFDRAIGNALAGEGVYAHVLDARGADDFSLPRAAMIESVTGDFISFCLPSDLDGVFLRVYEDAGGHPQEPPIHEEWVLDFEFEDLGLSFVCGPNGFCFPRITARGLALQLQPGTYWVNLQPVDRSSGGDWFWQLGQAQPDGPEADAHMRDGDLGDPKYGWYGHQDWRSTEGPEWGNVLLAMRIAGHSTTVCDRIESLSARCRRERVRVEVESSLQEGTRLTILNGERQRRMTIRKDGRGRVHFDGQFEDGEVAIEGCEDWTRAFDCPG